MHLILLEDAPVLFNFLSLSIISMILAVAFAHLSKADVMGRGKKMSLPSMNS
jgi:hypothetical protein